MTKKSQELLQILKKVQALSSNCESIYNEVDKNLQNIQYLSASLLFMAEEKNLSKVVQDALRSDLQYSAKLRYEDYRELHDKILEFFVDFLSFVNTNQELQKLFK